MFACVGGMNSFCRGSAIAKIVGNNVVEKPDKFEKEVKMWVFEENVNGRKLTEIINQDHENVKYLPGHKLPENVVSIKLGIFYFAIFKPASVPKTIIASNMTTV